MASQVQIIQNQLDEKAKELSRIKASRQNAEAAALGENAHGHGNGHGHGHGHGHGNGHGHGSAHGTAHIAKSEHEVAVENEIRHLTQQIQEMQQIRYPKSVRKSRIPNNVSGRDLSFMTVVSQGKAQYLQGRGRKYRKALRGKKHGKETKNGRKRKGFQLADEYAKL